MATSSWVIDPAHTDVLFTATHMMVTRVRGKFTEVAGRLALDEEDPTRSTAEVSIKAASVDTGVAPRDEHLRSADFFDVANHPEITFRSRAIERRGDSAYRVVGDLTIKGVTRPVEFDVTVLGFYRSMKGARRVGFAGSTTINREDWGLTWNVALEAGGWLVGKEIRIEFEVAAEEQAGEASQAA